MRFPHANFKKVVPEVLENGDVDTLNIETGSIEITNIKVNYEAIMDTNNNIEVMKRQWFQQVEEDSKNLFKVAEDAIEKKPELKVIIVKRLQRFDRSTQDIFGIKQQLSCFSNSVYDHLWIKHGSPSNIQIVDFKLNLD